ncbi:MAG: HlyD family secretion protein, partial [Gammaproteobacteria bacterium]|nr:HlyD family secretion protein [Gammaproteobacteria bacterium]
MNRQLLIVTGLLVLGAAGVWGIMRAAPDTYAADEHGHQSEPVEEIERGPHGGRLLRDGPFSLELQIYEADRLPEFRLFAWRDDEPLDPAALRAAVELTRLGGRVDRFEFVPRGDYL